MNLYEDSFDSLGNNDYATMLTRSLIPDLISGHWRVVANFQRNIVRNLPQYNQFERDIARYLHDRNSIARTIVEANLNFVVGTGFEITSDNDSGQSWLDDVFVKNNWIDVDRETLQRLIVDGEVWRRALGNGEFEFLEPEQINTPVSLAGDVSIKDGIKHEVLVIDNRPTPNYNKVIGYYINDQFVAKEEIQFRKTDNRRTGRGLPEFTPVKQLLWLQEQVIKNIGALMNARSKFALIRKHKAAGADVGAVISSLPNSTQVTGSVRGTENIEDYKEGSIIDSSAFSDYDFPFSNLDGAGYEALNKLIVEQIAARFQMPLWIFSKESDMAAYSASMVAESSCVRQFTRRQAELKYLDTALINQMAELDSVDLGKLTIVPPRVATRNIDEELKKFEFLIKYQLVSEETVAGHLDIDLDEEKRQTLIHNAEVKNEVNGNGDNGNDESGSGKSNPA